MADIADIADDYTEARLQSSIHAARTAKPPLAPLGSCHSCGEQVPGTHLFCDGYCQEDWERVQAANARAGITGVATMAVPVAKRMAAEMDA